MFSVTAKAYSEVGLREPAAGFPGLAKTFSGIGVDRKSDSGGGVGAFGSVTEPLSGVRRGPVDSDFRY
jgi:hypothetical protein